MTQENKILAHLQFGASITPVISMAVYGIARLSAVIEQLRLRGYEIDCVMKFDAMGKKYGEYRLRRPIAIGSVVQVRRGFGIGLPTWVRRTKASKVIGKIGDASLVRFIRGKSMADEWVNDKELVNAD